MVTRMSPFTATPSEAMSIIILLECKMCNLFYKTKKYNPHKFQCVLIESFFLVTDRQPEKLLSLPS